MARHARFEENGRDVARKRDRDALRIDPPTSAAPDHGSESAEGKKSAARRRGRSSSGHVCSCSLFPDPQRATNGDELPNVIRRVIGDQVDGPQIGLIAFARWDKCRQILHLACQRLHLVT